MRLLLSFGEIELTARLVQPVRGHAGFGDAMHVVGAQLRFQRRTERSEERRVQRLVTVGLGNRDVILELARDRLVESVQYAQSCIACGGVVDEHADAVDVEYLGERVMLLARSEEHTSELQSHSDLVCRLLLEKKKEQKQWDN